MMVNRIRDLRKARGWSLEELADRAGTSHQQIGRLERGERRLTLEWMQRIAKALAVDPKDLISPQNGTTVTQGETGTFPLEKDSGFLSMVDVANLPKSLPIYRSAISREIGMRLYKGAAIGYLGRPPSLALIDEAYATRLVGSDMHPRYDDGELVVLNPARTAIPGEDVFLELRNGSGEDGIGAIARRLRRRTSSHLICERFEQTTDGSIRVVTDQIPVDDVAKEYCIMRMQEVMAAQ